MQETAALAAQVKATACVHWTGESCLPKVPFSATQARRCCSIFQFRSLCARCWALACEVSESTALSVWVHGSGGVAARAVQEKAMRGRNRFTGGLCLALAA